MSTTGDGTDGRSGWCGRGAHHRCIGAYDAVCGCTCHHPDRSELSDLTATPIAPHAKETAAVTTTHNELTALMTRIESMELLTTDYNTVSILGVLYVDGVTVDQVSDNDFYKLLLKYTVEDQTDIPCPEWCDHEHGHVFELSSGDGSEQSRHHSKSFLTPTGDDREVGEFYIAVTAEETRLKPVDATARLMNPYVWAQVDGDLNVEQCRRFAAALMLAADELERVTQ